MRRNARRSAAAGALRVRAGDGPLPLGAFKQRALLALLLLSANRVVPRERLTGELWGDNPLETAAKAVQVFVSRLRKLLPPEMLVTQAPGYRLRVAPESVDLPRFERLLGEARDADPARAASLLAEALALWRGPPLAELGVDEATLGDRLAAGEPVTVQTPAGKLRLVPETWGTRGYDDLRIRANRDNLGRGARPAVASLVDCVRMLDASERESDAERLVRLRRVMEPERQLVPSRGLYIEL